MIVPTLLANTIWVGAYPYSFRFFGLHVVAELPLEAWVIWLLIQRREKFGWLFVWVLLANTVSFFLGPLILLGFDVPKTALHSNIGAWLAAFAISFLVEGWLLRRWLQAIPPRKLFRACFWGNVASYTIAFLVFVAYLRGVRVPWLTRH